VLFVFCLPLHVHGLSEEDELSYGCSCVLGRSAKLALAPAPAEVAPRLVGMFRPPVRNTVVSQDDDFSQACRAPPLLSMSAGISVFADI